MLDIFIIRKPLNNHIEFEWKFKFLMKIMKMCVAMVTILPMWWPLDRFQHLHHVEFGVKFKFLLKIYLIT